MSAQDVLAYWLDQVGPDGWYAGGEALDAEIADKFADTLTRATEGGLGLWLTCASEALAYIIVTDQFSRNMYRGQAAAFATDPMAKAAARMAVNRDWDLRIDGAARQFFYMPFMHSENLFDQDRAVRLFCARMPQDEGGNVDHARAHREIIRRFGRFPARNAALGRPTTRAEQDFMDAGGYAEILKEVRDTAA